MRWSLCLHNPNHAATLCAMAVCFGLALSVGNFTSIKRIFGIMLVLFATWLLTMTASHSGFGDCHRGYGCRGKARQFVAGWCIGVGRIGFDLHAISSHQQSLCSIGIKQWLAGCLDVWKGACQVSKGNLFLTIDLRNTFFSLINQCLITGQ
jgi:hypothetical protein